MEWTPKDVRLCRIHFREGSPENAVVLIGWEIRMRMVRQFREGEPNAGEYALAPTDFPLQFLGLDTTWIASGDVEVL